MATSLLDTLSHFHIKLVPRWTPLTFHSHKVKVLRQVTVNTKLPIPGLILQTLTAFSLLVILLITVTLHTLISTQVVISLPWTLVASVVWEIRFLPWTTSALLTHHIVHLTLWTFLAFLMRHVEIHRVKTIYASVAVPKLIRFTLAHLLL